jgi:hypothetical protein
MNSSQWDAINLWASQAGLDFVFDVNVAPRDSKGKFLDFDFKICGKKSVGKWFS